MILRKMDESIRKDGFVCEISLALLFFFTVLAVHFASVPFFFLYEDDYFHVGIPATQSAAWVWEQIRSVWVTWPQGRPAFFTVLALEGRFIAATGSIAVAYVIPLLILSLNGYLTYRLLGKRLSTMASFWGAMIGVFSCADPHKILLTHTPLQLAIGLNLAGIILYLNNRRVLAYFVAGSSLLIYEISFGIFLAAELFYQLPSKISLKRLIVAWGSWLVLPVAVFAFRFLRGESRAVTAAANPWDLVDRIFTNLSRGPLYGLENSYWYPFIGELRHAAAWPMLISLFVPAVAFIVASRLTKNPAKENTAMELNPWICAAIPILLIFVPYSMQLGRTVFPGFVRPVTGYHLCLGFGLAVSAAMIWTKAQRYVWARPIVCILFFALSSFSAYQNLLIQYDYVRSARYQAHFWAETRRLASDATPGDVILVPRQYLPESEYILSNSWGVTHAWETLFEQTGPLKNWTNVGETRPVTVFLVPTNWENAVTLDVDGYNLNVEDYTPPGFRRGKIPLRDGHVIILEANYSAPFHRRTEPIHTKDASIRLKEAGNETQKLNYTVLARHLFKDLIN